MSDDATQQPAGDDDRPRPAGSATDDGPAWARGNPTEPLDAGGGGFWNRPADNPFAGAQAGVNPQPAAPAPTGPSQPQPPAAPAQPVAAPAAPPQGYPQLPPLPVAPSYPTAYPQGDAPVPPPYAADAAYTTQPVPVSPVGAHLRHRGLGSLVAVVVATALVAGLLGGLAGYWVMAHKGGTASAQPVALPSPVGEPSGLDRAPTSVAGLAARVQPSVVVIKVSAGNGQSGTGSGFVLDGQGHILTNNHVVAGANGGSIRVVFSDGSQKPAQVVGTDASYDLAVVKADVGSRPALALGDSDKVVVGDPVIAIGAPLGLQGTVTTGIVSARNRPVSAGNAGEPSYINAIQTDAAINPGNSGGPLVDAAGNVIGVNTAIAQAPGLRGSSGAGGNIGVGFAIPSNQAKRTAMQLIQDGRATHPVIGISLDPAYDGEGVQVATVRGQDGSPPVARGGPADKAGIQAGDVITAVDGRPVTSPDELIVAVRAKAVGDTAVLTVRRGGDERRVTVTLAAATG